MRDLSVRRMGRIAMYGGLVASGTLLIFYPSQLVDSQVSHVIGLSWSISMVISSFICFVGSVTDRWIGEYAGIPLLASVIALYGISAFAGADGSLTLVAFGLLITSFAAGLAARWQDVRAIKHVASYLGAKSKEA